MALTRQTFICVLLLACLPLISHGEEFPQCAQAQSDTFIGANDDCSAYIYCNGEDSFRDSCPEQTYFDDSTQECAFDDAGVCLKPLDPEEEAGQLATEVEPSQSVAETHPMDTASVPATTRPQCDPLSDSVHPHPQRCEYFYRCLGGFLTIVRCPFSQAFDSPAQQCRPKADAQCFSS
ncbi:hypothetical protein KR018_003465 [Drosophila ironensis]|nr:hypothetical protein KR018_003465 [Drosophila ironensis]